MTASRAVLLLLALLAPVALADPAADCEAALAGGKNVKFGALVVEQGTGEVVWRHAEAEPLVPASNQKVLTTAAALALLGPGFVHETRVVAVAPPLPDGLVPGDLVVVGAGDPTISRRFDPEPLLSDWAEALWRAGVRRVAGDVVADDRAFEATTSHASWDDSDLERWYGAEVGALVLNDGCIDITVMGAPGRPRATLAPNTSYVAVEVLASATSQKKQHVFSVVRAGADKRTLRVTGKVWTGSSGLESSVPVRDPGLFFATVLRERLLARGIAVAGGARRARAGEATPGHLLHVRRAPLARALEVTNKRSQNLYAECLLKTLGRAKGAGGTWAAGADVVSGWAKQQGVAAGELTVEDGSGLSRGNRLSARALVTVLRAIGEGPHGARFRATLAVPGEEGTLDDRLKGLPQGVTVHAKTGTLRGVSSLSGYLVAGSKVWVFSMIGNGGSGGRPEIDACVKRLAKAILN